MIEVLKRNDIISWTRRFVADLDAARSLIASATHTREISTSG
jgi:hypothetical protein